MPQENSKIADPDVTDQAAADTVAESSTQNAPASDHESGEEAAETVEGAEGATQKKKRSRKRKIKDAISGKGKEPEIASTDAPAGQHLGKEQLEMLLQANPALKNELESKSKGKADMERLLRNLNINEMMTGLAPQAKNVKDMGSYEFWKTQPVPSFDEMASDKDKIVDGPIKEIDIERVRKEPSELLPGFEWVTMNLEDAKEMDEVYDLLYNHYVEDQEAMFRFRYSPSFLNWHVYLSYKVEN
jgi:glycylpeptide N-tetradecanoyltransferase